MSRYRGPKFIRFAIPLLVAPLLLWSMSATVRAAPPGNDTFAGATPVTLGFSEVIDTTEATMEPDDILLGLACAAPVTNASVWYAFTTTEDTRVEVDAFDSDYGVILIVSTSKLSEDAVACGPGKTIFFAGAGITYYVMAFDSDFGGNGGNLSISFTKVPPPIVELTLDPTGHFNAKTGTTTLSGTYTCSGVFTLRASGLASQSVGKSTISGLFTFFAEGACDGAPHPWSAEVSPQSGQFKGGKTQVVASVFTCDDPFEGCIVRNVEQTVKLKGGNGGASAAATEVQLFLPAVQGSQP